MPRAPLALLLAAVLTTSLVAPRPAAADDDELPPPEHHWEKRPRKAVIIVGVATFAGSYLLPPFAIGSTRFIGSAMCHSPCDSDGPNVASLFIPVAGPILYARDNPSEDSFWWYVFAAGQVGGIVMTTYGLASSRQVAVRNKEWASVTPMATPGGAGLSVFGAF